MIFYKTTDRKGSRLGIIHIGIGLIGTAIKNTLLTEGYMQVEQCLTGKINWDDSDALIKCVDNFFIEIDFISYNKIYVVWSAGKAGFGTSLDTAKDDFSNFKSILSFIISNISRRAIPFSLFMLSSGGGLFEGQTLISKSSIPSPKRPYGQLKLWEEKFILSHSAIFERSIFRISSVYSAEILNKRKGLILVLMENGLTNKVSTIVGNETTLRDYVLDKDIARYLIRCIYNDFNPGQLTYLASGRPCSIFQIKKQVEKILKKRIYISYAPHKHNAANISYAPDIIAKGFRNTDFITSLNQLFNRLLH